MTLYSTLYRNCRLYPRFASLVAAAYVLVGLIVTLCVGISSHSLGRGLYVAAVVLLLTAIADVVAYLVLLRFYSRLTERLSQVVDQFASVVEEVEKEEEEEEEEKEEPYYYDDEDDYDGEERECPNCHQMVSCLECHADYCEGEPESEPEIVNAVTPLETSTETEPPLGTVPTATEPEIVVEEVCVCGAPLSYTDKAYLDSHPDESRLCHQCWSQMNHRI